MDKVKAARSLIQEALAQSQNPCFTCSFQAEDVVVLHLLLKERPEIPVLFLDTGYHFPEVYAYRDELQKRLGFRLVNLTPALSREEQERLAGRMAAVIALREAQVSGNEVGGYMRRRRCVRWPRTLRPPLSRFILAIVQN